MESLLEVQKVHSENSLVLCLPPTQLLYAMAIYDIQFLCILLELLYAYTSKCACMLSHFSHVQLFATLWTVALQAPLSMGFSRQEYWNVLPCPPPGAFPDPGIAPLSLRSPAPKEGSLPLAPPGKPIQANICMHRQPSPFLHK